MGKDNLLASPALPPNDNFGVNYQQIALGSIGNAQAALLFSQRPRDSILIVDEMDSLLTSHTGRHNPLLMALSYSRNLMIHVIGMVKTMAGLPTFLREQWDVFFFSPPQDLRQQNYLISLGLPIERIDPFHFYCVSSSGDGVGIVYNKFSGD